MNIAIIGAGQIAKNVHVNEFRKHFDMNIIAVVDNNFENAKKFCDELNIKYAYTSIDEMYLNHKIDITIICTPNKFHYNYVIKALTNNSHVLCEKPPSISSDEALQMHKLAVKNNLVLCYNFHHRFSNDIAILKDLIDNDYLGEIYHVKINALRRSGVPGWGNFIDKELQGGGPLIDIGIHMLDSTMYLLDFPIINQIMAKSFQKIANVKSSGTFGKWDPSKYTVEDSLFAFIKTEKAQVITLETSFALNIEDESKMSIELHGVKKGATVFPLKVFHDENGKLIYDIVNEDIDESKYEKSISSFIKRCQGEAVMSCTSLEGYYIQDLIEKIYQECENE